MPTKSPIHSRKHIVQYGISQITTATRETILLIKGVEPQDVDDASEVVAGAVVKAIYIELWLHNQANLGETIVTVSKDQENSQGPSFANMADLHSYAGKKNILFTHQGLASNDGVSGPMRILSQWIAIPKGKQRFGLGDKINMNIANVSSNDLNRCGVSIYKEYQ